MEEVIGKVTQRESMKFLGPVKPEAAVKASYKDIVETGVKQIGEDKTRKFSSTLKDTRD